MFQLFERRLLVDTRTRGEEPALIRVVDRVRSADERFRELLRLRPRFPSPDRIVAFQWPRTVRTMVESGVWDAIKQRVGALGVSDETCESVLAVMRAEERKEEMRAVLGEEPYRTLKGMSN
jgi:hypothetical protein